MLFASPFALFACKKTKNTNNIPFSETTKFFNQKPRQHTLIMTTEGYHKIFQNTKAEAAFLRPRFEFMFCSVVIYKFMQIFNQFALLAHVEILDRVLY